MPNHIIYRLPPLLPTSENVHGGPAGLLASGLAGQKVSGAYGTGCGPKIKLPDFQIGAEFSIPAALGTCGRHLRVQFRLELGAPMPMVVKIEVFAQMPANERQQIAKTRFRFWPRRVFLNRDRGFSNLRGT